MSYEETYLWEQNIRQRQPIVSLKTMRRLGIQPVPAALVGATIYHGQ
jgi:hypothetical protein